MDIQEGPTKICVNKAKMRTTSSIEAYNCALNKRITSKVTLFTFIHDIRNEEFNKYEELHEFILSGSGTAKKAPCSVCGEWFLCLINGVLFITMMRIDSCKA